MQAMDSILDFVVGDRELGILIEEDGESRKNLDILEHVFLLLEVFGRERKILFMGKRSFGEGRGVHPAPGEVCSG